jgi:transcriptional regulator with XRE-family HTH domain
MTFGERLRELRTSRGWTIRQLAMHAGVDHGFISRVERGAYSAPRLPTIDRIAQALELSRDEAEELRALSGRLQTLPNEKTGPERSPSLSDRVSSLEARLGRVELRLQELEEGVVVDATDAPA